MQNEKGQTTFAPLNRPVSFKLRGSTLVINPLWKLYSSFKKICGLGGTKDETMDIQQQTVDVLRR